MLVEFYAPWCGHCIALEPEYKKAAKMLLEADLPVSLAKVDATKEKKVAERFKIEGFPTLKFFNHGQPSEYSGPREADGIVDWLTKKSGPQWTEVESKVELDKLVKEKEAIAVGFFSDLESSWAATKLFREVASMVDDVDFYIVSKPATMKEIGATEASIRVMKSFDEPIVDFKESLTKENLKRFIEDAARPLITEFKQEHAHKIFEMEITQHFLLFVVEYFAGNLEKFLKSEPLPEDWDASPVKTLVSSNFDKVAKDKSKDVFVKFYAPWCGHCKAIAPIWDQIGEKYSDKGD